MTPETTAWVDAAGRVLVKYDVMCVTEVGMAEVTGTVHGQLVMVKVVGVVA